MLLGLTTIGSFLWLAEYPNDAMVLSPVRQRGVLPPSESDSEFHEEFGGRSKVVLDEKQCSDLLKLANNELGKQRVLVPVAPEDLLATN